MIECMKMPCIAKKEKPTSKRILQLTYTLKKIDYINKKKFKGQYVTFFFAHPLFIQINQTYWF